MDDIRLSNKDEIERNRKGEIVIIGSEGIREERKSKGVVRFQQ